MNPKLLKAVKNRPGDVVWGETNPFKEANGE